MDKYINPEVIISQCNFQQGDAAPLTVLLLKLAASSKVLRTAIEEERRCTYVRNSAGKGEIIESWY